jgi:uncharacterized protein YuzE
MRLTYSVRGKTAYLALTEDREQSRSVSSQPIKPPGSEDADDYLVLDFDDDGRLVGIEFLTPHERLLPGVLARAERLPQGRYWLVRAFALRQREQRQSMPPRFDWCAISRVRTDHQDGSAWS